jgi:hypothetical protein
MAYNNLRFFDNESNDLNLIYNSELELWQGVSYLPLVSTGLYETLTLHILEEVEGPLGEDLHTTPIAEADGEVSFKFRFNDDYNTSTDIFLYSAKAEAGEFNIKIDKEQSSSLLPSSTSSQTFIGKKLVTGQIHARPIVVQAALSSDTEGFHIRTLSVIEVVNGIETREIASIKVYGEVEGEDERLKVLLDNMGMNLDNLDYYIFRDSNIQEQSPDHIILNQKRKELLLQASQIKPFIGTYKAILNAIDFFGYDKITLKEYWLNINEQSENFGKLKAVAIPNQDTIGFLADKNKGNDLPNSNQKKTSRFSLVYRLNAPTGLQDEWDIPTVKETMDYSPDEVLIKLYGLKKKLQKEYLPLQAKIVDITGEGDYFSQFNQNVWNNQHNIKVQNAGVEFKTTKVPAKRDIFIEDLRKVDYRLTGIRQDFNSISKDDKLSIVESINNFYEGYYDNNLNTFNTIDGIPIGAPISLHVKGIEDGEWNLADLTWEDAEDAEVSSAIQVMKTDASATNEQGNILDLYMADHDSTINNLLTWENWWHRGVYEIEWVLTGPRDYNRSFRGPIDEYNNMPLTLPYAGSYSVETNLYDLYNVKSTKINSEWIEVKNKNVEIYGLTQLAPPQLDWKNYKHAWDNSGSDWDWSRENLIPVNDVIGTYYLTMDRSNYVYDEFDVGIQHSTVRRYLDVLKPSGFNETPGPYQWADLKTHVWDDGPEVTWKMTRIGGDINSSFQIKILGESNVHPIMIEQINPMDGKTITDSYIITSDFPNGSPTDLLKWQGVVDELSSLDSIDHPILTKFNFNPIFKDVDNDGDLEENTVDECIYILCVGKEATRSYDFSNVYFNNDNIDSMIVEKLNFISYNPGFDDTYIINNLVELHKLNHVTFSYDLTNMPGIISEQWKVINNTLNVEDIYYNNPILTHLFKHKGYYTVELDLLDSNGNTNTTIKNILNII